MAVSLYKDVKCKGYSSNYSYRADITENSYDIVTNKSNVTIDFYMNSYGSGAGFEGYFTCQFGIWVDGVKMNGGQSAATTVNSGSTYIKIGSWTGDVAHNTDGSKKINVGLTFRCNAITYYSDNYLPLQNDGSTSYPSGTPLIWDMGSVTLTTIPRASGLTASDGTLGIPQTLTVTRYATSFTHTITYTCGNASGTVCTKSTSTSVSFTPPIDLASQNTTGVRVSIALTIITYSGSTEIGRAAKTITCDIPASVKPSCSLSVSDAMGYYSTYGGYIKGQSKFKVAVTSAGSYGSEVKSIKTTANGATYTSASFTTDVIKTAGTLTISVTVTDSRGRTGTASVNVSVLDYAAPRITRLTATRCNANGTANEQGTSVKVTFSSAATSLSSKNRATYTLKYKKSTVTTYTAVTLTAYSNNFAVTNGTYIFTADTGASYDITLVLSDAFNDTASDTGAPTAFALMHWKADGTAVGIGKVAEKSYTLDLGVDIELNDNTILKNGSKAFAPYGYGLGLTGNYMPVIADCNTCFENGFYNCAGSANTPFGKYGWMLVITGAYTRQEFFTSLSDPEHLVRHYVDGVWSPWEWVNPPMWADVEYRTTERWQGAPVYTKLISCGTFPSASTKMVSLADMNINQVISCVGYTPYSGASLPSTTLSGGSSYIDASVEATRNAIIVTCRLTFWTEYTCYAILKYTKF